VKKFGLGKDFFSYLARFGIPHIESAYGLNKVDRLRNNLFVYEHGRGKDYDTL
jgi:hypothetical protein